MTKRKLLGALLCIGAVVVLGGGLSWARSGGVESTDNAYVRGDITSLGAKVGGYVTAVEVRDNQAVRAGDVLFRIDDRDYRARVAQAEANVDAARARLANTGAGIQLQHSLIAQAASQRRAALADQVLANRTSDRRRELVASGFISRALVDESDAGKLRADAGASASAATLAAQNQKIAVLATERDAATAALAQAQAALELARIDLDNTIVRAPISGVVGNRQIRVGRLVTPGPSLLDIVPIADVFVVANFKETQLKGIRPGQAVRVIVDGYPAMAFEGTVDSFAPGSGSAFSLIPIDNATGNFVRVVQRVSVKIRLRRNTLVGRLVPGLSARVEIEPGRSS